MVVSDSWRRRLRDSHLLLSDDDEKDLVDVREGTCSNAENTPIPKKQHRTKNQMSGRTRSTTTEKYFWNVKQCVRQPQLLPTGYRYVEDTNSIFCLSYRYPFIQSWQNCGRQTRHTYVRTSYYAPFFNWKFSLFWRRVTLGSSGYPFHLITFSPVPWSAGGGSCDAMTQHGPKSAETNSFRITTTESLQLLWRRFECKRSVSCTLYECSVCNNYLSSVYSICYFMTNVCWCAKSMARTSRFAWGLYLWPRFFLLEVLTNAFPSIVHNSGRCV
jgi:hypothetical protein